MSEVSVVMATFNGERFLAAQLRTLAAQTLRPYELIVADDGSTDKTLQIVENFASTAPFPVKIIRNTNRLGYGENFLNACSYANGDLLAFCDQDDLWREEKLAYAVNALDESGACLFLHGATLIDESDRPIGHFNQRIKRRQVLEPLQLGPWSVYYGITMVFNRSLLSLVHRSKRGPHTFEHDGQLSHDLWVYFLASSLCRTIIDPIPLVNYRQHSTNSTPHLTGNRFRRWTSSLGKAVDPNLPRHEIAFHRASVLQHVPGPAGASAEAYWETVGGIELKRTGIYRGKRRLRAKNWSLLTREGGYRRFAKGGLGRALATKDLLAGVIGIRR